MSRPLVLIVLDGFGLSPQMEGNAVRTAQTPNITSLMTNYPFGPLEAAGMSVGVMWGEMGNSEVGHLGIGAGQVVYQSLPRIAMSIEDGSFFKNEQFLKAIEQAKQQNTAIHLVGLASSGGVHAHIEHLEKLLELCAGQQCTRVYIHMITDGRDSAPQKALEFLEIIKKKCSEVGFGEVATVGGRYWGMDRNNNWDRIEKHYAAMTEGKGAQAPSAKEAVEQSYAAGKFDEEIVPTVIMKEGKPTAVIQDGDVVFFFNYREDRSRQLVEAFAQLDFKGFARATHYSHLAIVTMIEYEKGLPVAVAFSPQHITTPLGKVVADSGMKQLRLAETEKYAHVTYFFNGGQEDPFPGEEHALIASKKVESYATVPEMSAREITERFVTEYQSGKYGFILMNFANPDMVGHTGDFAATVAGIQVVDECLGKIIEIMKSNNGILAITADHGNAEQKIDPTSGSAAKEHTANPVPFIIMDEARRREKPAEELEALLANPTPIGILADVAPTLLALLEIPQPSEMTGKSLLEYMN